MNTESISSAMAAATHKFACTGLLARPPLNSVDKCRSWLRKSVALFLALAVGLGLLSACATVASPRKAFHSFSFEIGADSPGVELLDYRYGSGNEFYQRPPGYALAQGRIAQQQGVGGYTEVGTTLYAKWRIQATGAVHEDTVDLSKVLPPDMSQQTIHFTIDKRQLFVFLVTPTLRRKDEPIVGPSKYHWFKVIQLYPRPTGPVNPAK